VRERERKGGTEQKQTRRDGTEQTRGIEEAQFGLGGSMIKFHDFGGNIARV
jgi:hypothetical protein